MQSENRDLTMEQKCQILESNIFQLQSKLKENESERYKLEKQQSEKNLDIENLNTQMVNLRSECQDVKNKLDLANQESSHKQKTISFMESSAVQTNKTIGNLQKTLTQNQEKFETDLRNATQIGQNQTQALAQKERECLDQKGEIKTLQTQIAQHVQDLEIEKSITNGAKTRVQEIETKNYELENSVQRLNNTVGDLQSQLNQKNSSEREAKSSNQSFVEKLQLNLTQLRQELIVEQNKTQQLEKHVAELISTSKSDTLLKSQLEDKVSMKNVQINQIQQDKEDTVQKLNDTLKQLDQKIKQNAEMSKKFSHLVVSKSSDLNNEIGDEQMESIIDNYQKIEESNR